MEERAKEYGSFCTCWLYALKKYMDHENPFFSQYILPLHIFPRCVCSRFFYPSHKLGVGREDFLRHPQQNRENNYTVQICTDLHLCNHTKFSKNRLPDLKKMASRPLTYERVKNADDILSLKYYLACLFYLPRSNTKNVKGGGYVKYLSGHKG